jgi:hypothetical protein
LIGVLSKNTYYAPSRKYIGINDEKRQSNVQKPEQQSIMVLAAVYLERSGGIQKE